MENKSSIELLTKRNLVLFLIAFIFLVIVFFYSELTSTPTITVSKEVPITFHLSGRNRVISFYVANESGVVWGIIPNGRTVTLADISTVKYGEVPPYCQQIKPENNATAPTLIEGEKYHAGAAVFDDRVEGVYFMIKDGKVIELPRPY